MQEGNISHWRVKEGDTFTAGDVILEIETDKATMDVEAQDDGVLFKIMRGDGSKGVRIGERIAVLAEEGDDLGELEVPVDEGKEVKKEAKEEVVGKGEAGAEAGKVESRKDGAAEPEPETSKKEPERQASTLQTSNKPPNQKYPLFPSVQQLLHQNGLSNSEAGKIPASGPQGRLLKGDVLAYFGQINKDYPAQASERLAKLSHLDLSNIQIAAPSPAPEASPPKTPSAAAAAAAGTSAAEEVEPPATQNKVAVPISLTAVIATQKRVQDSLGIFLPLSTFVARASEMANLDLPPASKDRSVTAEDLFHSLLGLDTIKPPSRGHFVPQITGLPPSSVPAVAATAALAGKRGKEDVIDFLAPKAAKAKKGREVSLADVGVSAGGNVFSVFARKGEERRAEVYLERMKGVLEGSPGRLVL